MRRAQFLASAASTALLLAITATSATAETPAPTTSPGPSSSASAPAASPATLTVVKHKKKVTGFTKFTYQTGKVSGIDPKAAAKINKVIAQDVNRTMLDSMHAKNYMCSMGLKDCGYFVQTLQAPACKAGNVCITAPSSLLPQGSNTGYSWVDTWVFDASTGAKKQLKEFVTTSQEASFLTAVKAGITAQLAKGGITNDPNWKPFVKMKDVYEWLPSADGLHIYFAKYDVAPGSFGVVSVDVPWSAFQ
ncbi:MAG: RsiV family protein [Actinomycetota bacterium]|nr:RsiV family protein [Actinomycetota bacterium]